MKIKDDLIEKIKPYIKDYECYLTGGYIREYLLNKNSSDRDITVKTDNLENLAKKIADKYKIEHKVIKLPFLKESTNNSLTNENKSLEFKNLDVNSMKAVWVPNRNGLFLNIAAMYCDAYNIDYIIFGANKEEAGTFSDNSVEFNNIANEFFKYSTLKRPSVISPVINLEKFEIINLGIENKVDFSLLKSCYNSSDNENKKHCKKCESCKRLYNAILKSNDKSLINLIF